MDSLFHWFWADGVFYILYIVLAISGFYVTKLIIEVPLKEKMNQLQYLYRLRKIRKAHDDHKSFQYKHPIIQHIYLLVKTTSNENSEQNILSFLVVSIALFASTFIMMFINFGDIVFSLFLGLLIGLIPYMFLQVKLRKIRFLMGKEFLNILHELTQNYNAHAYDMYHALIETQKSIKNKTLRQVFLKLISDLQVSRNEDELRLSIKVFIYTAGTSWAKRLGNIILKSYLYDENVLNTLLTLTRQVEETEEMLEQEKSNTMDKVYDGYLTVPLFIASLGLGYNITGAQDWFSLQFANQWSSSLFITACVGVFFSVLISLILKRPKNDI